MNIEAGSRVCPVLICRTPLHADVYSSFSWSVNVCGRKRWLLFPPGEEDCLRDTLGNLAYDAESSELRKNQEQYPQYRNLKYSLEVIQEAGEAIFVPSGWHHQVWNLVSVSKKKNIKKN